MYLNNNNIIIVNITECMQELVPGLAIEEFSTPPSSPVLVTRIIVSKITADSSNNKEAAVDSPNYLVHGMQLGESMDKINIMESVDSISRESPNITYM